MKHLTQVTRYIISTNIRSISRNFVNVSKSADLNLNSRAIFSKHLNYCQQKSCTSPRHLNVRFFCLGQNNLAKNKDKGKDKKKKPAASYVDENEMSQLIDVEKYKEDMNKVLDGLKNDLIKNISVRSSAGSIEEIKIKMDDKTYTIQELTQIVRKPKMVVINCSTFPQATKLIVDALNNSGMNLNPQQEGTTLYVPTLKVTKEHREQLAKNAKQILVQYKDSLKAIQNKQIKYIKERSKVSQELAHRVQEQIKALCQKYVSEAEKLVEAKQKEVLGE